MEEGEAAKGESQEFSSGDSNGHRPDKATHEILLGGICAANPEKELRKEGNPGLYAWRQKRTV